MGDRIRRRPEPFRFRDENLDFLLLRAISYAGYGGAALGECLRAADRVDEDEPATWVAAWDSAAERAEAHAEAARAAGHPQTARDAFLRAWNYRRTAGFFVPPEATDDAERWERTVGAFEQAARLLEPPAERLEIPFDEHRLPGWFLPADGEGAPRRTLVLLGGLDGGGEETHFSGGAPAARARGWNVVVFHAPGHRGARHRNRALLRPSDGERAVAAVLDHVLPRPDVDPERVALAGFSLGAHLAPRAAAADPRIRALVADGAITDLRAYMLAMLPAPLRPFAAHGPAPVVNAFADLLGQRSPPFGLFIARALWSFGVPTPADLLDLARDFRLGRIPRDVTCPTLTLIGEGEGGEALRQARGFHDAVSGPKTLRVFTAKEGAHAHLQMNNLALGREVLLDWLDDVLGGAPKAKGA